MILCCNQCGHLAAFMPGVRYCATCSSALPITACSGCGHETFPGDQFCAFCAQAVAAPPSTGLVDPEQPPRRRAFQAEIDALFAREQQG